MVLKGTQPGGWLVPMMGFEVGEDGTSIGKGVIGVEELSQVGQEGLSFQTELRD